MKTLSRPFVMSGERWVVQEATGSEGTTTITRMKHGDDLHRIKVKGRLLSPQCGGTLTPKNVLDCTLYLYKKVKSK